MNGFRGPRPTSLPIIVSILAFVLASSPTAADPSASPFILEAFGGVGYTMIDKELWTGQSESALSDWNETASRYGVRVLYDLPDNGLVVGLEYGYSYFLYYQLGQVWSYATRDVDATSIFAIVRQMFDTGFSIDVGIGSHSFGEFSDTGFMAAANYWIPAGERLSIPVGIRLDSIRDPDTSFSVISASAGVSYRP